MTQKITIAHSPDSDDAFMFYALATGKITSDKYQFQVIREDIETLNHLAQKEKYDITALSFHAYAYVADKYVLTASGASFAEKDYGPIVVSKNPLPFGERADPVASRGGERGTIAIPGTLTTAALLLKMAMPNASTVVIPFDKIIDAVLNDEVDAGLLIHEGQLQYEKLGLTKILSLTEHWNTITACHPEPFDFAQGRLREGSPCNNEILRYAQNDKTSPLPLPLGGTAIRKSLGIIMVEEIAFLVKKSIRFALDNPDSARQYALQFKRHLTEKEIVQYLSWYANDKTLEMGKDGRFAVQRLLDVAHENKIIAQRVRAEFV